MRARFSWIGCVALLCVAAPVAANGMLGIFFDEYGSTCSASVNSGGLIQMYVVFLPEGDTRGGITTAEFKIEMQDADGYNILGQENLLAVGLGDPFAGGITLAGSECLNDLAIPLYRFTVQNISGGSNAKFVVKVRDQPSVEEFPCALVTLCDNPKYTPMCVETGKAVLNPTGSTECGSNSESAEWSRIKELYR